MKECIIMTTDGLYGTDPMDHCGHASKEPLVNFALAQLIMSSLITTPIIKWSLVD